MFNALDVEVISKYSVIYIDMYNTKVGSIPKIDSGTSSPSDHSSNNQSLYIVRQKITSRKGDGVLASMFGAPPQIALPTSKVIMLVMYIHLVLKIPYAFPLCSIY
jgi:hypothetical protein